MKPDYAQNTSKREVTGNLFSKVEQKKLQKPGFVNGRVLFHVRHLGNRFHPQLSNVPDRNHRIRSMRTSWTALGSFWHSHSPYAAKRLAFQIYVQSFGLAGMESNNLSQTDNNELDK